MRVLTKSFAVSIASLVVCCSAALQADAQVPPSSLPLPLVESPSPERPVEDLQVTEEPARVQGGLPRELILPPPSSAALKDANKFVEAEINPEIPLPLVIGRAKILQLAATPSRIFLGDEEIATAEFLDQQTGRQLAVTGKRIGSTVLTLWFQDSDKPSGVTVVSYLARVYADPSVFRSLDQLEKDLNLKFPDSFVQLQEIDNRLVVRGQARDAIEMAQILQIISGSRGVRAGIRRVTQPKPGTIGDALNFSNTDNLDSEEIAADNRSLLDPVALAQAGIINLMQIPGEQQVMLRVTVAEVNRNAARSVGLNFTAVAGNNSFTNTTGSVTANLTALLDSNNINLRIEALRSLNLSRTLAEPNLVAINGRPANFQAGGQFPIPVLSSGGAGGNNLQGVQFVPFGVQLRFLPLIQDRDVIRLQIQADVSTRDESLGANIGGGGGGAGTAVPGLNSRNFSTTVELRSGQTLAVAGLLQSNFGASSNRVPFWGDLPLIGATGGVNRTSAAEQELVILVTPELVAPVDSCEALPLPGNDVFEPTDVEFFLANRLESRRSRDFRSPVRTDYAKQRMPDKCCPDKFLVGGAGPTDRCCNQIAPLPHQAREQSPK